jgi:D-alanyl-D-alanine carboxypeptidase/D-alanyl-D-alanine-endopeptidase (penicillin-binding protein 4)
MRLRFLALPLAVAALAPAGRLTAQNRPTGPLARHIAPLFHGRAWRHAEWGALVVSLGRGDTLFSYHADRQFLPASNAKLFTTAAALHYLGPGFRFLTVLFADGPVRDGTLDGNLVLYGTGDPTFGLDTAELAPFADSVVHAGIRTVRGDLVGDASYLGGELTGPGWSPDDFDHAFAAPPSALGASQNFIRITVRPGARTGAPAQITIDPPTDYYTFTSVVVTGRRRSRTRIAVDRGPPHGIIALSGVISPRRRRWTTEIVIREPAAFAASLLRQLLAARGVTVSGVARAVTDDPPGRASLLLAHAKGDGNAPFEGAIAVRESPTLGDLVTEINHLSDNLSAELVFRSVGRAVGGAGSFASGAKAVARFLADAAGIPPARVQITDGSGLSLQDEATPRALVQLLAYEQRAPAAERDAFWRSLPGAGDALGGRMGGTAAEGRLRAKTGTLRDVSALTGYVTTEDGELLAFSIVVNHMTAIRTARRAQDRVGVLLARFRRTGEENAGK